MNDKHNVMVDIETLGTGHLPTILSIGAVVFDLETGVIDRPFKVNICMKSSQKEGFGIDAGTLQWWWKQDPEAQAALFTPQPISVRSAL